MIYILIAIAVFLTEHRVKNWIETTKTLNEPVDTACPYVVVHPHHNKGTAGGKLVTKQKLIAGIALIFTLLCTLFFVVTLTHAGRNLLKLGLALLLGGAFSNTYDRLKRKYVVDYIQFRYANKLGRYIYNISDFAILIGALLIGFNLEK